MIREPMTREMALFSILVGCAFWAMGILGKNFAYRYGHRPAPLWHGRLVFGLLGSGSFSLPYPISYVYRGDLLDRI